MRPAYGQHFLKDSNLLKKIIRLSDLQPGDQVLEIGPGDGALTEHMLELGCRVLAFEIDKKLEAALRQKFSSDKNFTLIMADALESKHQLCPELLQAIQDFDRYAFVSNLPYAAGTPILLNLWQSEWPPEKCLVMLQKEVGQRITADAGGKAYGTLSVLLANVATSEYVADIPPSCFTPPPKVDSCLISMKALPSAQVPPAELQKLVQLAFMQRRKQIGKRFEKQGYALKQCQIEPSARAENLSPEQFFCLVKAKNVFEN